MISFGFRLLKERCLFQELCKTFHLNALKCSSCCWVASWPVCQRFCWRVAHRQHHHCCVVELDCFLAFEEVSVVDVATGVECCTAMGPIKHILRSNNCLYVWKSLYSFILTYEVHSDMGLIHVPWRKESSEPILQDLALWFESSGDGKGKKWMQKCV